MTERHKQIILAVLVVIMLGLIVVEFVLPKQKKAEAKPATATQPAP